MDAYLLALNIKQKHETIYSSIYNLMLILQVQQLSP